MVGKDFHTIKIPTMNYVLILQVYLKIHKKKGWNSYTPDTIILDLLLCFT